MTRTCDLRAKRLVHTRTFCSLITRLSVIRLPFVIFSYCLLSCREITMNIGIHIGDYLLFGGSSESRKTNVSRYPVCLFSRIGYNALGPTLRAGPV